MARRFCCPACFGDQGLRDFIFPILSTRKGKCGYCGTDDVQLVDPADLGIYFTPLANVYRPDPGGQTLAEWFGQDWQMFKHPAMDLAHAKELLGEIFDDGDLVRQTMSPAPHESEGLFRWEALRAELMHKNRWFLEQELDTDRLRQLFELLIARDLPTQWFRARITSIGEAYTIDQMNAPPNRLASHGRANPAGIPYLYLGSQPETAIAEIRPHTGDRACVADFTIPEIKAVDLRSPRAAVSPFILTDEVEISQLRSDLPFLERLGEELTRPVLPQGAAVDYIPSQYLCEFIKHSGFDGVVYRSSVSDGINLALFDLGKARGGSVEPYLVSRVSVDVSRADAAR